MSESKRIRDRLSERRRGSMLSEWAYYLKVYRKWWLLPLIAVLLLFGILVIFSESAAAPFIYSLF